MVVVVPTRDETPKAPRIAHGGPPNHDGVASRLFKHPRHVGGRSHVPVANNLEVAVVSCDLLDFANGLPRGRVATALLPVPRVHRQVIQPHLRGRLGHGQIHLEMLFPRVVAEPYLGAHGPAMRQRRLVLPPLDQRLEKLPHLAAPPQLRGPRAAPGHARSGAAKI